MMVNMPRCMASPTTTTGSSAVMLMTNDRAAGGGQSLRRRRRRRRRRGNMDTCSEGMEDPKARTKGHESKKRNPTDEVRLPNAQQ